MEIESQRLDFLTLTIHMTKAQNILEHIREGRKKKKKKTEEPRPSCATWAARDLGRTRRLGSARRYRRGVLEVLLSFFCFFLSGFLFGCSENH